MGADIHIFTERKVDGKWVSVPNIKGREDSSWGTFFAKKDKFFAPFNWRNYGVFGFLADVRNYSCSEVICEPKGFPDDSEVLNQPVEQNDVYGNSNDIVTLRNELDDSDYHSKSWLTLKELLDFDYEKTFWDRRISRTTHNEFGGSFTDGAALANEGEGKTITYRDHLGESFFKDLETLKTFGNPEDVRIIFYFDN